MAFCRDCGAEVKKVKKFCPKCGTKFSKKLNKKFKYLVSIGISILVIIIFLSLIPSNYKTSLNKYMGDYATKNINEFGNLGKAEIKSLKKVTPYCGDGDCSSSETCSNCPNDCGDCLGYCGDGTCDPGENCKSCSNDCGICEKTQFCGDGLCQQGECASRCSKDCSISDCKDGVCDLGFGENCGNSLDCACSPNERCEQLRCVTYCGNNNCDPDETCKSCSKDCGMCECIKDYFGVICQSKQICNDGYFSLEAEDTKKCCVGGTCEEDPSTFPIIFVHGHSPRESDSPNMINAFSTLQAQLSNAGLYTDMGYILPGSNINEVQVGEWGNSDKPISVRTTYYRSESDNSLISEIGNNDNLDIDQYAQKLSKVVDIVRHHTGSSKVKIVAHSMGGLVTRQYLKFHDGWKYVDRVLTIGTPNHGIRGNIEGFCGAEHSGLECIEMTAGSGFLINLNSGDETYMGGMTKSDGPVTYATITGRINSDDKPEIANPCGDGTPNHDEVVCANSVPLNGAYNYNMWGNRISGFDTLHSDLVNPNVVSEVYTLTKDFLIKKIS